MSTDPASAPKPAPASGPKETPPPPSSSAKTPAKKSADEKPVDPLRGSRTSGFWVAVVVLVIVLLLLAIFVLQNTQKVEVTFLGWNGSAPLSASLLIAAVAGAALVASAGALRIFQLRRRVKRDRKSA